MNRDTPRSALLPLPPFCQAGSIGTTWPLTLSRSEVNSTMFVANSRSPPSVALFEIDTRTRSGAVGVAYFDSSLSPFGYSESLTTM